MPDLRPFRGVRYNPERIPDLGAVLAPPYDVIDPPLHVALLERSPHNVVRLEYGPSQAGEESQDEYHAQAAALLQAWLREGVLAQDPEPAFYLHQQSFTMAGRRLQRSGLLAAVRLYPWEEGVVRPHEMTSLKPIADRMGLLRASGSNISPVFGLYRDQEGVIAALLEESTSTQPLVEVESVGEQHRLWALADPASQRALTGLLAPAHLYIADGHHRYEAALAYSRERESSAHGGTGPWQYVLMSLTCLEDPGLAVLPLHRLLRLDTPAQAELEQALEGFERDPLFLPERAAEAGARLMEALWERGQRGPVFALYRGRPGSVLLLSPRGHEGLEVGLPDRRSTLDVTVLQQLLLSRLLPDPQLATDTGALAYTPWASEALSRVEGGEYTLSILVNPVAVSLLASLADGGQRLPPKSTYFYPKLPTGLVLRLLNGAPA